MLSTTIRPLTPTDLDIIERDAGLLADRGDDLTRFFYKTLFELRPDLRAMFPADLVEQRSKLLRELGALIGAALSVRETGSLDDFTARARRLGTRHVSYGVHTSMYDPVGQALVAALGDTLDDFDDEHVLAWVTLYGIVSKVMIDSAQGS